MPTYEYRCEANGRPVEVNEPACAQPGCGSGFCGTGACGIGE